MNKELESLSKKRYTSLIIKNVKDFLSDLFDKNFKKTLNVNVENKDTKISLEIAKNTRGLKGKLDDLLNREIDLSKLELGIDMLNDSVTNKLEDLIKKKVTTDSVVVSNFPEPTKEIKVTNFPEPIKEIKVSNLKDIKFPKQEKPEKIDFSSLETRLDALKTAFNSVSSLLPELKPKEFPKFTFPKELSMKEGQDIQKAVSKMEKTISDDLVALAQVIKEKESGMGSSESGEIEVKVKNFPPTSIPTPVTNFNLNSLRGLPLSTVVQVGTTATPLPDTPLEQRRSLIVFNNSGNTVYLGGVDVTTSTGLPLLDQSYSPPIDAGQHMIIYAIASSSNNELRVFEVSNDAEGN